jgi:hypothetical protein
MLALIVFHKVYNSTQVSTLHALTCCYPTLTVQRLQLQIAFIYTSKLVCDGHNVMHICRAALKKHQVHGWYGVCMSDTGMDGPGLGLVAAANDAITEWAR